MITSFLCKISFMDNMNEFSEVIDFIGSNASYLPFIAEVPYSVHQSSTATFIMADDSLSPDDIAKAYNIWSSGQCDDDPDEWFEVKR